MNNIPEETIPEAPAFNGSRTAPHRGSRRWQYPNTYRNGDSPYSLAGAGPRAAGSAFDFWSLLDPLLRRWTLPVLVGTLLLVAGLVFALNRWSTSFTSTAQLLYATPATTESGFRPRAIAMPTLTGLLRSPELLRRVGAYAPPRSPPPRSIDASPSNPSATAKSSPSPPPALLSKTPWGSPTSTPAKPSATCASFKRATPATPSRSPKNACNKSRPT